MVNSGEDDMQLTLLAFEHLWAGLHMLFVGCIRPSEFDRAASKQFESVMESSLGCELLRSKARMGILNRDKTERCRGSVLQRRFDELRLASGQTLSKHQDKQHKRGSLKDSLHAL